MSVSLIISKMMRVGKRQFSTKRKRQSHRQSRNLSNKVFRIGYGQTLNVERNSRRCITKNSTVSDLVSMTEATSHLVE